MHTSSFYLLPFLLLLLLCALPSLSYQSNMSLSSSTTTSFSPVYSQDDPGHGIGGFDLASTADRAFAFDYYRSGKLDHLVLYRPGTGSLSILRNNNDSFTPVYQRVDPGNGIGQYDLKSTADRAFAFNYDHCGKLDHIVLYRPGSGAIYILRKDYYSGVFSPVYSQITPGNGIGGYDLLSPNDRAFAFDYDGSGRLDHIVLYRPGSGIISILHNDGGNFIPMYPQSSPGSGIGGYDLMSTADRAFAFDYNSSGKRDHIVLYRPGSGIIMILRNSRGNFAQVFPVQGGLGNGVGQYDLLGTADHAFSFDYDGSGKLDHIVLYRPGSGAVYIIRKDSSGVFSPIYAQVAPGNGIGGYDLLSPADRAFAFDYGSSCKENFLTFFQPGTGKISILART